MEVDPETPTRQILDDYTAAYAHSNDCVRSVGDPDELTALPVEGEQLPMRWVLAHMTTETRDMPGMPTSSGSSSTAPPVDSIHRAYGLQVRDRDDHTAQRPTETLQGGPSRPPFFQRLPARWRQPAVALLALALGVAAGAGTAQWWQDQPASQPPPPHRVDEHAVELLLFEAVLPRTQPGGREPDARPLQVDAALLLSGAVTSTVLSINNPNHSLDVRAPALPVTVSPTTRYQPVDLTISVRNCKDATRWVPADRPFTITWRDEYGKEHLDSAGDFDQAMADSLIRYVDAVCGNRLAGPTVGHRAATRASR